MNLGVSMDLTDLTTPSCIPFTSPAPDLREGSSPFTVLNRVLRWSLPNLGFWKDSLLANIYFIQGPSEFSGASMVAFGSPVF